MVDLAKMFGAGAVETFMGWPKASVAALDGAQIAIFGAATATPYASVGPYCADGPAAIRAGAAPYAANASHYNFDLGAATLPDGVRVVDCGDLAVPLDGGADARAMIADAVRQVRAQGAVPVLLGGDDSVPIPFLDGLAAETVNIVQVDAHIDWRAEVMGEPLGLSSTMRRASEMGHVGAIAQVGQRGLGSARVSDVADAEAYGVKFVSAGAVHRGGARAYAQALPEGPVVLVFDVDAFDPGLMPAAIGRTAGGLRYEQALELVEQVATRGPIVGVTLAEFMPQRDIDGQGALLVSQFLTAVIGIIARQV